MDSQRHRQLNTRKTSEDKKSGDERGNEDNVSVSDTTPEMHTQSLITIGMRDSVINSPDLNPDKMILKNLNIHIPRGSFVGIIGE